MRRPILMVTVPATALWSTPGLAQQKKELGPLCTTDTTLADQQIDACNKILALKVFSGEKLATIYFWRAVGWWQLHPGHRGRHRGAQAQAGCRDLQSARLGLLRQGRIRHRDCRLQRRAAHGQPAGQHRLPQPRQRLAPKGDYARAIADYDASIKFDPKAVFSYQNRGVSRQALGDLDGALADINEAIRLNPALASPLTNRAVIWRAKGDIQPRYVGLYY